MALRLLALLTLLAALAGCVRSNGPVGVGRPATPQDDIVLLSVTSDAKQNPQAVDMAMKLAGFSLDEGRKVVLFFNVKGVHVPTNAFPDDFAFEGADPLKDQLRKLMERGAEAHVCPVCMKALGVEKSDIMEGAQVTTRPKLFANIGAGTAVFTY